MRPGRAVLALASAIALTLGACGGERATGAGAKTPTAATTTETTVKEKPEARPSAKGKRWGGWRYQGSRDDCFFRVKRRCFTKRADACAAARCGKKQCAFDGGGPVIVSCQ